MKKTFLFLLIGLCLAAGTAGADKLLTFDRQEKAIADPPPPSGTKAFTSGRAKERFLSVEREKTYALPKAAIAAGVVDTITIVALKISFAYEETDDPLTTGRGTFDLRDTLTFLQEEGHALDPAPHNSQYFNAHLRSLAHYWEVISEGKLHLEYEIWPRETDTGSYYLDETISHFGQQAPAFGLGEFFHDALLTADAAEAGALRFRDEQGRKKVVLLFHAGADRQTDLWFSATPTPNDLFTGFLTFDEANQVVLSQDTIVEGLVMPETMSQDNRVTTMNAVLAHEFGHQLGLIDLYNTGSSPFLTQVGDFALMDNMGMNTAAYIGDYGVGAFGTVPLYPMAWSRAFLGFVEVVEYRQGTSLELAAAKMQTDQVKIVKVPISATEYYLLENRRGDVDGELSGLRQDSVTNVILWPVRADQVSGETVLTPVPEYDAFLPDNAAGIAIWHVDEMVAAMDYFPFDGFENNFDANTLQWDPNRRFVTMAEADGLIDFGGNYHRGFGSVEDLFFEGNNSHFGTVTNPPTISNDGGYTHIEITNISAPAMVMTFDLAQDRLADGFPRRLAYPDDPSRSPVAADLDGDGDLEILTAVGRNIMAISADGTDYMDPLGNYDDLDTIYSTIEAATDVNSMRPLDTTYAAMPVFARVAGNVSAGPVVAEFGDTTTVMVGTDGGRFYSFLPYTTAVTEPERYRAEQVGLQLITTPAGAVRAIVPYEAAGVFGAVYLFYENGQVAATKWDSAGIISQWVELPGKFVGVCRYSGGMAHVHEGEGQTVLYMTPSVPAEEFSLSVIEDSVVILETGFHPPIATDFDRDGIDEVVLLSRTGHVLAYSFDQGNIEEYTALHIQTGDTAACGPAAADLSGEGFPELIVPGTNRLYGYDRNGLTAVDFPMHIDDSRPGQVVIAGPIISDINGDERPDLAVITLDSIPRERSITGYTVEYPDSINYPDSIIVRDTVFEYAYYNYYSNVYVISPGLYRVADFPVPAGAFGIRQPGDTIIGTGWPLHMRVGVNGYLVTTGADGWLYAWKCGWSDKTGMWPMAGLNAAGDGRLSELGLGAVTAVSEFLPEDKFFNYPNPATGGETRIRFYVNQPAEVTIAIYDALGDKVEEMVEEVFDGNREAEVVWDVSEVASGVYHCRLEAVSLTGSESHVAFKTIAVVK